MLSNIQMPDIMRDIILEIEYQLHNIIKSLTYKRYLMYKHGYYISDNKFDNIVYKIIEQNDDEYKYDFYFIDPESTLNKIEYTTPERIFKYIIDDVKSKYANFQNTTAFPNIYNTFLTNMFDIYDIDDNHPQTYVNLYLDYAKKELKEGDPYTTGQGWYYAVKKFNINISNIFPLQINTEDELLQFVK